MALASRYPESRLLLGTVYRDAGFPDIDQWQATSHERATEFVDCRKVCVW